MSMKIQTFETIMIFHERLTDIEYEETINEYIRLLKGLPAAKIKTDKLGKKNLAYKTRGCTQGWYVLFTYESTEDLVNHKLDLILRKDDKVIKFLTIKLTEDEAKDYIPDEFEDVVVESEQPDEPVKKSKKIVDVFDLIFGLEEVI